LTAGSYSVTVVDANNCSTVVANISVEQPMPLIIDSLSLEDVVCYGDSTGRVFVRANGGTTPFNYALSPNGIQNNPGDFTSLFAGNYTITVTDANNCSVTASVQLSQNPEMLFDSIFVSEPTCHDYDNGYIYMTASGGVGSLLYFHNNGPATTQNIYSNLKAGYHLMSVIDSLKCRIDSGINLNQPLPVEISEIYVTPLTCSEVKDGTAIVIATGGVGGFTYYVRPGIRWNQNGTFNDLDKGIYAIKVLDSNQCEADSTFTIFENPNPMFTDVTKKDLTCRGYGDEGEAEVNVLGGVSPLSYLWSTSPPQITPKVNGLRFGWYYVNVIDANGCAIGDSVYINPGECCTELFLPNAFSPNQDGNNDEFRVISTAGIELIQFEIYNRWGQKVWDTYTYYDGWDGNFAGDKAAAGTYYYVYRYRCITDGKLYIKKGDIILVR
jgi:gliding motility-associated-like protein